MPVNNDEGQNETRQALFETMFESSADAILTLDDDIILDCNHTAEVMFGHPQDTINGKSVLSLSPERQPDGRLSAEAVRGLFTAALGGEPQFFEWTHLRADGTPFPVEISLNRVEVHKKIYFQVSIRDITLRKMDEAELKDTYKRISAAEKELRGQYTALAETEEMFRNPVEHSPVGVYLRQDGIIRYANPRFAAMFGYTRDEILNKPFEGLVNPGEQAENRALPGPRTDGNDCAPSQDFEFSSRKKDGTQIELEIFEAPMAYQGRPAFYGTLVDITERKKMESEIATNLAEKEMLLKEIHHRVKNNMQVISGLLLIQSQSLKDEAVKQLFQESMARIKSIALVHEQLYRSDNLSEIEYGGYLKKMFGPLFESYKADTRKIAMVIEADNVKVTIEKAVPCSLIVNELMSNSLKYAFPGDRKGEIRIRFTLDEKKENYILDYSDNGIGLPEGFVPGKTGSLGTTLINGLTRQLKGTLTPKPGGPGVHYVIVFPSRDLRGK